MDQSTDVTPRTNKAAYENLDKIPLCDVQGVRWCNLLNTSRQLERELLAAREALQRLCDCIMETRGPDASDALNVARELLSSNAEPPQPTT